MKRRYPILGMSCAACAATVQRTLSGTAGVRSAAVNFADGSAMVDFDEAAVEEAVLEQMVRAAGYELVLPDGEASAQQREERAYRLLKRRTVFALVAAAVIMALGIWGGDFPLVRYAIATIATLVMGWCAAPFFVRTARQLRRLHTNMDTLVALSTGIAYAFSLLNLFFPHLISAQLFFESSVGIVAFILLGRWLEARAKRRTGEAIRRLAGLQPRLVPTLEPDGSTRLIDIATIVPGMLVLVRPGARVAVDGTVVEGASFVDESSLTGEPTPVEKTQGSHVLAGTLNGSGALTVRCDKSFDGSVLSGVIRAVRDAQGSRAPVQQTVDKVAAVFVPAVILISVATLVGWLVLRPESGLASAVMAMTGVLIIACPCALGLATPTALMVGIGRAAEAGILIKDAESLQTACRIDLVALDKTGTLTVGRPAVVSYRLSGADAATLAAIESRSEHPLAHAISAAFAHSAQVAPAVAEYRALPGLGLTAVVDGRRYYVGNRSLLREQGLTPAPALATEGEGEETKGRTLVWLADETDVLGFAALADCLKPTSAPTVRTLKRQGIRTVLLTGDTPAAALAAAAEAGIDEAQGGLLPADKAAYLRRLKTEGHVVAMTGDGINDSAALAVADLSVAMGAGSDIAMESAQATLLTSDLSLLPELVSLSRRTMRTVRQNLFWAFVYNSLAIPLAATGVVSPMLGSLCMALSSVSVVGNSLRLRGTARRRKPQTSSTAPAAVTTETETNQDTMQQKTYTVSGMMCQHCRAHVERALNSIEGVSATVTLDPAQAVVTFSGAPLPLADLQRAVTENAGEYTLSE